MLKSITPSLVWPAVIDPKSVQVYAYLTQIERSQWLKPQQLARLQSIQLAARLRHAAESSAFFAPKLAGRDLRPPAAFAALASLPPLTRSDMQGAAEDIFCEAPKEHGQVRTLRTSGSTGQPVAIRTTSACFALRGAVTIRNLVWRNLDMRKTFAAIRANIKTGTVDKPSSFKGWGSHMSTIFHTGQALGLPISVPVDQQLDFLGRYKPAYLLTYPSNLRALLDEAKEPPPGLEVLMTIGETMPAELVAEVRERWHIPTYDEYSSEELGPIAAQCAHGNYHCTAEAMIVEVVGEDGRPCAPGEIGRVIVTDISNFGTALLRYEIRDYAEVGEPCACGRGLPVLKRILGRERNMMVLPDGSRFWPQFGMRSPEALALVRQYQIVQTTPTHLDLRIVADHPLTDAERGWLVSTIQKSTGYPFEIAIEQVADELPKGPNGKLHSFMCMV